MKATAAKFDYNTERRGYWATLSSGGHTVTLTEFPASLLSMLRAGVLTGQAQADAEKLELQVLRT